MIFNSEQAIGTRVRQARTAKNISQAALGAMLGVTFQQVQKYEKGTNRMAASTLLKCAAALGVDPLALLGVDQRDTSSAYATDYRTAQAVKAAQIVDALPTDKDRDFALHMLAAVRTNSVRSTAGSAGQ